MKLTRSFTMLGIVIWLSISGSANGMATEEWTYYINPGAVSDIVWHDGTVWCATDAGLYEWNTSDLTYRIHTANDGLPHNNVAAVTVAADGIVWTGTGNGGVAAYESGNWNSFTTSDGLPYNQIASVTSGPDSTVWAGTYSDGAFRSGGGISWYKGGEWQSAAHDTYQIINKISVDTSGIPHMIGSGILHNYAVLGFDGTDWTVTDMPDSYPASDIEVDGDGNVWILTRDNTPESHVYRRDGDIWTAIATPLDAAGGPRALAIDQTGSIWCASSRGGLATLSGDTPSIIHDDDETEWLEVFTVDDQGTVWAGTSTGGIARFAGGEWTTPTIETFGPGYVHSFEHDRNGLLYVSGATGLFRNDNDSWETVSPLNELPITYPEDTWDMFFDQNNTLWATGSNGLWSYDGTQWTAYKLNNNESSWCSGAVSADTGMLWTGWSSDGSLYQFDPATSAGTGFYSGYSDTEPLTPVLRDNTGTVWCVAGDLYDPKLFSFHDGEWQEITRTTLGIPTGFEWQEYTGYIEDADNNIWISVVSNAGSTHNPIYHSNVLKYDGTSWTTVLENSSEYLSLKMVDGTGGIWLTSFYWSEFISPYRMPNGILYSDGESTHRLLETDGLPSNHVNDIINNGDGSLFIATSRGICQYRSDLVPVGVERGMERDNQPESFSLIANYPNPFNPSTTIAYTLEQACVPQLAIFSINGQKIRSFQPGLQSSGQHAIVWDGKDDTGLSVASGVYVCRMTAGGIASSTFMTLMR